MKRTAGDNPMRGIDYCTNQPAANEADMIAQAERILRRGPQAVLIKGGPALDGSAIDLLMSATEPPLHPLRSLFQSPR